MSDDNQNNKEKQDQTANNQKPAADQTHADSNARGANPHAGTGKPEETAPAHNASTPNDTNAPAETPPPQTPENAAPQQTSQPASSGPIPNDIFGESPATQNNADPGRPQTDRASTDTAQGASNAPQNATASQPTSSTRPEAPQSTVPAQAADKTEGSAPEAGHAPPSASAVPTSSDNAAPAQPQTDSSGMNTAARPDQPTDTPPPPAPKKEDPQKTKKKFRFKSAGLGSKSDTPPPQARNPQAQKSAKTASAKKEGAENNIPRGALNAVVTRNEYYRDGYRNLLKVAFIEGLIICGLIVVFLTYMTVHRGNDRYFATTADGRILQMTPLDQPNMSTAALMSWVSQAATEVMTFGFHDYQRRLQDASRHFTRRGWESFTSALQRSRIIESVETLQQVVTAAPRSAPVLLQEGVFQNRYRWVVRLPLTVTFRSGNKTSTSNLEVTITIERVPTLESPNGVGIESWIAV